MIDVETTPFTMYNLAMGLLAAAGTVYLLYTKRFVIEYRRFLSYLCTGILLFAVGGPLVDVFAPEWSHVIHGIAAMFVLFGLYDPVHNDLRKEEWIRLLFEEPEQLRHPREWMRPVDEQILKVFNSSELVLTPSIIAYNIGYSSKEVNRRLSTMTDHGYVERIEHGKYRMTEVGGSYLHGRLDAPQEVGE